MDASRLRPLRVGEVLDVAIKIYRYRFGDLAKAVAIVAAPVAVLNVIIALSIEPDTTRSGGLSGGTFGRTETVDVDGAEVGTFIVGFLLVTVVSWIAMQLSTAACFDIVSGTYLDREPTWRESLRFAWRRMASLVWLETVYFVLLILSFLLCFVPGVYVYVAWTVAVPVLLFEGVRGRKALKRSRELLRGRWWPTAAVVLLVMILTGILSSVIEGLLFAAVASTNNEVLEAVGSAIARTGASVLTTPFSAAAAAVIYYDALVRKEGFDLQQLAAGFGVDAPMVAPDELDPPRSSGEPPFWPPPPGWKPPA